VRVILVKVAVGNAGGLKAIQRDLVSPEFYQRDREETSEIYKNVAIGWPVIGRRVG
jgi:hypothetical protein